MTSCHLVSLIVLLIDVHDGDVNLYAAEDVGFAWSCIEVPLINDVIPIIVIIIKLSS